ncbi:MAG: hypothetical protein LBP76_14540, partial [Treponema sp.]|nr:hypothetical protein [Treponema sp.]
MGPSFLYNSRIDFFVRNVEVPVYADKAGLHPVHVGSLPAQLAVLVNTSARCEELAV